jgi:hypothetical protein
VRTSVSQLKLTIVGGDASDPEEIVELARQLQEELLELDVIRVESIAVTMPPGSKGGEAMSIGALVIGFVASSRLLGAITSIVQSWLTRAGERSVKLDLDGDILEVRGISSREQSELVRRWIDRHGDE